MSSEQPTTAPSTEPVAEIRLSHSDLRAILEAHHKGPVFRMRLTEQQKAATPTWSFPHQRRDGTWAAWFLERDFPAHTLKNAALIAEINEARLDDDEE